MHYWLIAVVVLLLVALIVVGGLRIHRQSGQHQPEQLRQALVKELYTAVAKKETDRAKELLEKNLDLLRFETPNGTWLHVAARSGDAELVEYLVEAGVDINAPERWAGSTPISFAASEGHTGIVEYLLAHGAVLDASKPEANPLYSAVHGNHMDIVKMLVEHGIDVSVDYYGKNAISFAKSLGHTEIADFLSSISGVEDKKECREEPSTIHDCVVNHLRDHLGQVEALSLQEIVGQLRIHVVPATSRREAVLLATSGASLHGDNVRYELIMVLPRDWDLPNVNDSLSLWPVNCLRAVANYGGKIRPEDTFSCDETLKELTDVTDFSGFIVLPELNDYGELALAGGELVRFLVLVPLYEEEIELVREEGLYGLLSLFHENNVDMILDTGRANVGLLAGRE